MLNFTIPNFPFLTTFPTIPTFTIPTIPTLTFPTVPTGPGSAPQASGLRVRPGGLITAELMNEVLDRLDALETALVLQNAMFGPDVAALRLGNLAVDTHTLVAVGTGFETGGGIWLDGQSLLSGAPGRGITLVVLDSNLTMKWRQSYDTFGSSTQANQLASDLRMVAAHNDIVIGITHDAYRDQLTPSARNALAAVGAAALGEATQSRDNAAFISVVPNSQDGASFNYLTSVVPADGPGVGTAQLAASPFAWGFYSRPQRRFLLGGATTRQAAPSLPTVTFPTQPTFTFTFPTQPTFTFPTQPTLTVPFPTVIATFPTVVTQPTFTATFPTVITQPTFTATFVFPTVPGVGPSLISPGLNPNTGVLPADVTTLRFEPGVGLSLPREVLAEQPTGVVRGIGDRRTMRLSDAGITTLGALASASPEHVAEAAGVSRNTAADYIAEARNLLRLT